MNGSLFFSDPKLKGAAEKALEKFERGPQRQPPGLPALRLCRGAL